MKKIFLTLACLTALAVGAVAAWNATRSYPESAVRLPIADYLPTGEAEGWTYEDLPLGHTESLDARAHELLNLTDYVYRRYTRGSEKFEIYVAYWAPGKTPARQVSWHTPDTCWVGAGWTITERDDAFLWEIGSREEGGGNGIQEMENSHLASSQFSVPGTSLSSKPRLPPAAAYAALSHLPVPDLRALPGRWRIFEKGGSELPVVFWHLLEGEAYRSGHQSVGKRLKRFVFGPFQNRLTTRQEQWLIRLSE